MTVSKFYAIPIIKFGTPQPCAHSLVPSWFSLLPPNELASEADSGGEGVAATVRGRIRTRVAATATAATSCGSAIVAKTRDQDRASNRCNGVVVVLPSRLLEVHRDLRQAGDESANNDGSNKQDEEEDQEHEVQDGVANHASAAQA